MHISRSVILVTGLVALTGCSSSKHPDTFIKQSTVCVDKGWYGYHPGKGCPSTVKVAAPDPSQEMAARLAALERDQRDQKDRLAAELAVAKQRIADQRGIITWASTQSPVVLPLRFFNGKVISARDTSAHKATGLEFPVLVDVRSKPVSSAVVLR